MSTGWTVHKFGGTSLADADRYRAACDIVLSQRSDERVAVVVSAMSGVTNALIESVNLASTQDDSYLQKLEALESRTHFDAGPVDAVPTLKSPVVMYFVTAVYDRDAGV